MNDKVEERTFMEMPRDWDGIKSTLSGLSLEDKQSV